MKAVKGKSEDGTHGEKYADKAVKDVYAGANSPTEHETEERKHGGRTKRKHGGHVGHKAHHEVEHHNMKHKEHHHEHPKAEHRAKRKRGGHVHPEHAMHGEHAKHRADRKARKAGGGVGANMHPLSTAHKGMEPKGHKSYEPEHD